MDIKKNRINDDELEKVNGGLLFSKADPEVEKRRELLKEQEIGKTSTNNKPITRILA